MKKVAKVALLGLIILPVAFLGGCAKKCCGPVAEPSHHKLEKMKEDCGGSM